MSMKMKGAIPLVVAIFVSVGLLFIKFDDAHTKKELEEDILVVFLQVGFIFGVALSIYVAVICFEEKFLNCCFCSLENKTIPNIIKKFTARSIHIVIPIIIVGLVFGLVTIFFLNIRWDVASSMIGVLVLASCLLSQEPTAIEISSMWENENVNVGYGLASQYFNGYIKVLMSSDRDWEERIARYRAEQDVPIFGKLILLLPRNCMVWRTLVEADQRILNAQNLQPKVIYLSGIRREFRNTVWKINEGTRFVAEYPPSLSTIQDMCYKGVAHHLSEDKKKEQFNIFYHHLQDLINQDPYCAGNCKIICYDDTMNESLSEIIDHHITYDELDRARSAS